MPCTEIHRAKVTDLYGRNATSGRANGAHMRAFTAQKCGPNRADIGQVLNTFTLGLIMSVMFHETE